MTLPTFIQSQRKPTNVTGRRVRFARSTQSIAACNFFNDDSLDSRWYQHADYEEFRAQSTADAENVVSNLRALSKCIAYAYKTAGRIALDASDEVTLMEPLELVGPNFQLLLWCNAVWTRGNEKSVLNHIVTENVARARSKHKSCIVASQKQQGMDASTLRQQSEQLTRKSRVFARMMGLADACIALRSDSSSTRKPKKGLPMLVEGTATKVDDHPCQLSGSDLDGESLQQRQFCALQA